MKTTEILALCAGGTVTAALLIFLIWKIVNFFFKKNQVSDASPELYRIPEEQAAKRAPQVEEEVNSTVPFYSEEYSEVSLRSPESTELELRELDGVHHNTTV